MPMLFALILAAQPASAATSAAADWRPLGTARERYVLSWDAASVARGPEVVSVSFKTEALQSPESSPRLLSRMEIRCRDAMVRVVETITYAADGTVTRRDTTPTAFDTIPPTSHVAAVQRAVC